MCPMGRAALKEFYMFKRFIFPFTQHISASLVSYALWVENEAFKHENNCEDLNHLKNCREALQVLWMFNIFVFISNSRYGGLLSGVIYQKSSHLCFWRNLRQWPMLYTGFLNSTQHMFISVCVKHVILQNTCQRQLNLQFKQHKVWTARIHPG